MEIFIFIFFYKERVLMAIIDIALVCIYFIVILAVGIFAGRKDKNTRDFFLADRKIPWVAVVLSIVATEISAATFLAVPGTGFNENLNYIQFGLGSIAARFFIAWLFLTEFYKHDCTTVYEYLAKRFNENTRYTGAVFFFVTRILGCGARLMIAAVGLHVVTGWSLELTLILFSLIAIIYTTFGGIKAIVWTDVVQALIFIAGGFIALGFIWYKLPDGACQAMTVAQQGFWNPNISLSASTFGFLDGFRIAEKANHLELFHWFPKPVEGQASWITWLSDPNIFFLAFFNSLITTWAALGTDQDMTQRMLTCKDVKSSQRSLIVSGFVGIPVAIVFLFIGVSIYSYFQTYPDPLIVSNVPGVVEHDKIFAYFIRTALPGRLRTILVIGLIATAMSSLDSTLGALTSSAIVDIYKPLIKKNASDKHYLFISRCHIIGFGIILGIIAWLLSEQRDFLWLCLSLTSITYGSLLGIFLLGVLTQRGTAKGNIFAMVSGAILNATLLYLIRTTNFPLGWSWLILIGTAWTFCVGSLFKE